MTTQDSGGHELDAEDRNAMPDSEYAFPRECKEPLNDASHVRNAIARFNQVEGVSDAERQDAFDRIKRAARRFGVEVTESTWRDLGKPPNGSAAHRDGDRTRDELYQEAKRRNLKGRSSMTKAQLQRALHG